MSDDPKPGGLRASQMSWLNVTQEVSYSVWTNSWDRSLDRSRILYTPEVSKGSVSAITPIPFLPAGSSRFSQGALGRNRSRS